MPSDIVDVHVHGTEDNELAIRQQLLDGLRQPQGQKHVPTMLLYDERGLKLYDDITTQAPEYYLFAAEEEILKERADELVHIMHGGAGPVEGEAVIELGAGALRKTSHILLALSRLVKNPSDKPPMTYYALDLERNELERTLGEINTSHIGKELEGKIATKGMWGTYDDGLKYIETAGMHSVTPDYVDRAATSFLRLDNRDSSPGSNESESSTSDSHDYSTSHPSTPDDAQPPLHLLFLGSSLGNFTREEGTHFLRSLPLRPGSGDTLLIGLDCDNEKEMIEKAYNEDGGYTRRFIMNGLKAAGRVLGNENFFDENQWEYVNRYDEKQRRHEAFYRSKSSQSLKLPSDEGSLHFLENELIKVEESWKFSEKDAYTLFSESNLRPVQRWSDSQSRYSLWLLERPAFNFPLLSSRFACNADGQLVEKKAYTSTTFGVPSPQEWENVWALWDCITLRMIPPSMLYQKPIDLRHICLFYLGHIPAFLDIHLSKLLDEPHSEPDYFKDIFERGIDPNVDDPSQCHSHSEVPRKDEEWPSHTAILQFRSRVRSRLLKLYEDIDNGTKELTRRMGRVLFMTLEHEALHAETLLYMLIQRAGTGTISPPGFAIPDWGSLTEYWNTLPAPEQSTVTLGPATVVVGHDDLDADDKLPENIKDFEKHEYGWDNEHPEREYQVGQFRIEWRPVTNGEFYTAFKANRDRFQLPASWVEHKGETQVRTLYGPVPMKVAHHWPVATSFDNLSAYATVKGGRIPTEPELRLFYEKFKSGFEGGANIGFRNWHPIPATTGGEKDGGRGHNGGVWEWTSTLFDKYDGFTPSELYPGYSADFFDGCHQVVIGGSYATIPRIAERKSVRNWYQRNYPYPWVGARVVYDI
ncbi:hypothetical protein E1B28_012164 [Marasmius oreades]|uniref:DUF323 domain-containing protein n=1 Tax=Marasmius oreades TaxID=181124 RepID=A0A9P7UMY1_9AGAR|nr:uncharacterized protein E1B28_012164 [Marasmius oreades]KAG7088142.1 hypothetical protein E1B28_012164 [Marasmius oreades]